jgi:hypothetical protein
MVLRKDVQSAEKFRVVEFHNLYSSPNNNLLVKSKRMRWAGHVVRRGKNIKVCGF